ncbi:phosphoglycerate mutase-like protein [Gloeopeniophorella convolvens]|nr:phosphoglycerate mutase-like protein [Gloeopeniophorella convolvens]
MLRRALRAFALTALPFTPGGPAAAAQNATSGGGSLASTNGVYNSSRTPASLPWNTYNFCNAPHANAAHYALPPDVSSASQLVHVALVMRHHKRTPDNIAPAERTLNPAAGWDCTGAEQRTYDAGGAAIAHDARTPAQHPFAVQLWNGTCDAGQLTPGGLTDAHAHGADLWGVYHGKLGFLREVSQDEIWVRTSTEDRTMQTAGALLAAMDARIAGQRWPVHTQPSSIDSLVPGYACPAADAVRDAFESVPAWTQHLADNAALQARLGAVFGTTGMSAWESWYDHYFDALSARTCHGHPLPCNTAGACVSEQDAATVFALGDFEYDYIWRAAQNASTYNTLTFGVFFSELADALAGPSYTHRLALYVGHDGSLVRLLAGLGASQLRWPALGTEVIFEVWEARGARFVRVLFQGTPFPGLEWIALDTLVGKLRALVPDNLFARCMGAA